MPGGWFGESRQLFTFDVDLGDDVNTPATYNFSCGLRWQEGDLFIDSAVRLLANVVFILLPTQHGNEIRPMGYMSSMYRAMSRLIWPWAFAGLRPPSECKSPIFDDRHVEESLPVDSHTPIDGYDNQYASTIGRQFALSIDHSW